MPEINPIYVYFIIVVILISIQLTLNKIFVILKDINIEIKARNKNVKGVKNE